MLTYNRTVLYHPDKSPAGAGREAFFVHLKLVRDTLVHPTKRFAYDRLGPDVVKWQNCITLYDYVSVGFQQMFPYYVASGLLMFVLGMLGYARRGSYVSTHDRNKYDGLTCFKWRYLTICSMFILEVYTITRPYVPAPIAQIINPLFTISKTHPPYLPFQMLILARKIAITSFIALSQLSPVISPLKDDNSATLRQLTRLSDSAKRNDSEVKRILALELAPFTAEREYLKNLKLRVKEWLIQNRIRSDSEVRNAVSQVLGAREDESKLTEEAL